MSQLSTLMSVRQHRRCRSQKPQQETCQHHQQPSARMQRQRWIPWTYARRTLCMLRWVHRMQTRDEPRAPVILDARFRILKIVCISMSLLGMVAERGKCEGCMH